MTQPLQLRLRGRAVQFSIIPYDIEGEGDVESGAVASVFDVVGS
jgi:hypothetical protein